LTPYVEEAELVLAQREDFYVLLVHRPGYWAAFVGEGQYSSKPVGVPPYWQGTLEDPVIVAAEKYIRERDPSFQPGFPPRLD